MDGRMATTRTVSFDLALAQGVLIQRKVWGGPR